MVFPDSLNLASAIALEQVCLCGSAGQDARGSEEKCCPAQDVIHRLQFAFPECQ